MNQTVWRAHQLAFPEHKIYFILLPDSKWSKDHDDKYRFIVYFRINVDGLFLLPCIERARHFMFPRPRECTKVSGVLFRSSRDIASVNEDAAFRGTGTWLDPCYGRAIACSTVIKATLIEGSSDRPIDKEPNKKETMIRMKLPRYGPDNKHTSPSFAADTGDFCFGCKTVIPLLEAMICR